MLFHLSEEKVNSS